MKIRSDKRELDKIYKRRDRYEIPEWQREEVWDEPRKQLLIDSILRGWRLPKFYFVVTSANPHSYEVVDGQQRLAAIFEFLSNELSLSAKTVAEFGGATYKALPVDVSDKVDDFEIDYDEIEDASDEELSEFFQRLQSGVQLNSSEKLNAVQSKLRNFAKSQSKHEFFTSRVAFNDKRYAHFDVMAKVCVIEVDGIDAGLRYSDVKHTFEAQSNFSDQSQVAKRIRSALDFLAKSISPNSKAFRNRSITQSFITLICSLHRWGILEGREKVIAGFSEYFVKALALEIEKGQHATDSDFIAFQKSVNANVKSGPSVRQRVLLRKLIQFDPNIVDIVSAETIDVANFSEQLNSLGKDIRTLVAQLNEAHSAKHGTDLFKPTNKTVTAQQSISEPLGSFTDYEAFADNLYFLFWEGPGSKLAHKPPSFVDVNALRTELEHDVDHGAQKDVEKKKLKHGSIFAKYAGSTSPHVASPARFPVAQVAILEAIRDDLLKMLEDFS